MYVCMHEEICLSILANHSSCIVAVFEKIDGRPNGLPGLCFHIRRGIGDGLACNEETWKSMSKCHHVIKRRYEQESMNVNVNVNANVHMNININMNALINILVWSCLKNPCKIVAVLNFDERDAWLWRRAHSDSHRPLSARDEALLEACHEDHARALYMNTLTA